MSFENVLAIFCSLSKTISLAKQGGNNGNSWLMYTKLRFQPTEKTFWGRVLLGTAVIVLLQGSSHVTFLLMFMLFVSRQKSEQSLDIHLYVYMSFCFICYWFYLCRIVLSMIIIVCVEILQLRYIRFLQNTPWIYTVPISIPCCLIWLTGFFIGSMIICTVQFVWSHRYLVVIKYMSYVAVYIGI